MAEYFDGFSRRVHDNATILAMLHVTLHFPHQFGVKFAVDVLGYLIDDLSASNCVYPFGNNQSVDRAN